MYLAKTKSPRKTNRKRSARARAAAKSKNTKRQRSMGTLSKARA
ncbi:MAG: hypothetical protein QM756_22650 [Polyangiaceae bacterium]